MSDKRARRQAERAERMRDKQEEELRRRFAEEEKRAKEQLEPAALSAKGFKIFYDEEIAITTNDAIYKADYKGLVTVVAKIFDKENKEEKYLTTYLLKTIKLMEILDSNYEHIISFYDIFQTDKRIIVMMEYASKGNLKEVLRNDPNPLPEKIIKKFSREIALAICYLHANGVAHRHIKLESILLKDDFQIKLSGFDKATSALHMNYQGSWKGILDIGNNYCPPEIMTNDYEDSKSLDVWMYGVVVFYIVNKFFPFSAPTFPQLISQLKQEVWRNKMDSVPKGAKQLIQGCFRLNYKERMTIQECLAIPWLDCCEPQQADDEYQLYQQYQGALRSNILEKTIQLYRQ